MKQQGTVGKKKVQKEALLYKRIGKIWCPYFGEYVVFNAKGLRHIRWQKHGHFRSRYDQQVRFRLVPLASKVLRASHTIQGIFVGEKDAHYEFIAVVEKLRIRVIVKQVGNNPKYFWSVIPAWKTQRATGTRILHSGTPEED